MTTTQNHYNAGSSSTSKRKGDFSSSSPSSTTNPHQNHNDVVMVHVVEHKDTPERVGVGHHPHHHRVQSLKAQLQQRRRTYFLDRTNHHHHQDNDDDCGSVVEDPLYACLVESMGNKKKEQQDLDQLKKDSIKIQDDLNRRIAEAQEACQMESNVLAEQSRHLHQLHESRDQLLRQIDEMDQRQVELHHQIALHQQETTEEMEVIDRVEEERKREVPRLKHTLSLYASTTGIKWDFLQNELLSGSVVRTSYLAVVGVFWSVRSVTPFLTILARRPTINNFFEQAIPDRQGFRLFSIDPSDHDSVEVANQLWKLIEGVPHRQ